MKLVKEHLFEFKKGLDPVDSLGIGRKAQIEEWLNEMQIKDYFINDDYTIDVNNGVNLSSCQLIKLPDFIQFRYIERYFLINSNELTTLRGCPIKVDGSFVCSENFLQTLKYSPVHVGLSFICDNNMLTSLEYAPKNVYDTFSCEHNLKKFSKEDVLKYTNVSKENIII